ncbi:threonine ammonia-lyase [Mesorhizobium tianshanense]|uniref:Threonine dehydratase n=1 Tax=Mesorhizobium tianshanense TaxID=39844 RepID=A0A562P345_9HYPH|nr:threonine/serine dehydratase [Mesorhizobium tianshanense]TWI38763.1 threonine dehydratase [Mesorhizobium tianshanense]
MKAVHRGNGPTFAEIEEASAALDGVLSNMALFHSPTLDDLTGCRLLVKAETLQPTGSFKIRGAWNKIRKLNGEALGRGVLALSSGNHGLAVAWAARRAGAKRVVILMPQDAPRAKVEGARKLGAEVVHYDRSTVDRTSLVSEWRDDTGLTYVPAFDDRDVIAGAATVALHGVRSAEASGLSVDDFVVACSGGGLAAGSVLALQEIASGTRVWAAEPEAHDDTARSIEQGKRITLRSTEKTICDALLSPEPGELTFEINRSGLAGVVRGSDDHARLGMSTALSEFGLVAEPSGALALGSVLAGSLNLRGRTVMVVLSGRNVDREVYMSELKI